MKPTKTDTGRWAKALVSPRIASKIRKELRLNGSANLPFVGVEVDAWKAILDGKLGKEVKLARLRAPKDHKNDRTRELRALKIEEKMAAMPKRIEDNKKAIKDRKPKPGIETLFKKLNRTK